MPEGLNKEKVVQKELTKDEQERQDFLVDKIVEARALLEIDINELCTLRKPLDPKMAEHIEDLRRLNLLYEELINKIQGE